MGRMSVVHIHSVFHCLPHTVIAQIEVMIAQRMMSEIA